jgi:hypothetical protein
MDKYGEGAESCTRDAYTFQTRFLLESKEAGKTRSEVCDARLSGVQVSETGG